MRILVIEDDMAIGRALVKGFSEAGYLCDWMQDGESGTTAAKSQQADAIVLDQMLPKVNGLDLLRDIRAAGVMTPVILLTAMGSVQDRITGLNTGADDYMPKPFDFAELLARLNAVVRRTSVRPVPILVVNDLTLDLTTRRVARAGGDVDLTPIEFSLLELLMRYAGQVVNMSGDSIGMEPRTSSRST